MTARYTDAERWAAYSLAINLEHPAPAVVADLRRQARRYMRLVGAASSVVSIQAYGIVAEQSRLVANAIAREQRKTARS